MRNTGETYLKIAISVIGAGAISYGIKSLEQPIHEFFKHLGELPTLERQILSLSCAVAAGVGILVISIIIGAGSEFGKRK